MRHAKSIATFYYIDMFLFAMKSQIRIPKTYLTWEQIIYYFIENEVNCHFLLYNLNKNIQLFFVNTS